MSIDWDARIDDLAVKLARTYKMEDRLALEVMLAAMIDCPQTPSVWLVLETNWYSRECLNAWFSFGETWLPQSLVRLRNRNPWRIIEKEIDEYLDSPSEPHMWVECEWERYPRFHVQGQGKYLIQRALRIRTRASRSDAPLRTLNLHEEDREKDELATLASNILEDRVGDRPRNPPRFVQHPDFLYYCELVQKLAPWYPDWHDLVRAFGALAVRHAFLHGQTETGPRQDALLARVAADSISPWIAKAVAMLLSGPTQVRLLAKAMDLEQTKLHKSAYGPHHELGRLKRRGIIDFKPKSLIYFLAERHFRGAQLLLEGRSFGTLSACA